MRSQHTPQRLNLFEELLQQLQPLIVQHEYLDAMIIVLHKTDCRLHEALTVVKTLRTDTHRRVPERVEQRVRVLLATNQQQAAIRYLTQHTDMDERDSATYVDALLPGIQIRISEQEAQELLTLHQQGKTGEAAKRVRANNGVGLAEAVSFLDLLQTAETQSESWQVVRDQTDSATISESSHLPARVQARVERDFPEAEWDAVKAVLAHYGEGVHERVQVAVLQLASGDAVELLQWLQEAKQDYRDVLWAASDM